MAIDASEVISFFGELSLTDRERIQQGKIRVDLPDFKVDSEEIGELDEVTAGLNLRVSFKVLPVDDDFDRGIQTVCSIKSKTIWESVFPTYS